MLFRYPGGKQKLSEAIVDWLEFHCIDKKAEYRECFFGAGAIAFELLKRDTTNKIPKFWFNDYDPAIAAVWHSVFMKIDPLCEEFHKFKARMKDPQQTPDYEEECWDENVSDGGHTSVVIAQLFREWQKELNSLPEGVALTEDKRVEIAFRKIAVHQMSFSGLGPVKGCGPIGGDDQKYKKTEQRAKWGVGCRYNPSTLEKNARHAHSLMSQRLPHHPDICTCGEWYKLFEDKSEAVFYVDPPYCGVGKRLYQHGFSKEAHIHLRNVLQEEERPWLLSIDECEKVDELYKDKKFKKLSLPLTYSMAWHHDNKDETTGKKKAKARTEYVISNMSLDVFQEWVNKQDAKKGAKEEQGNFDFAEEATAA
jgi:site-specific DNA-adenine methylase